MGFTAAQVFPATTQSASSYETDTEAGQGDIKMYDSAQICWHLNDL